MSKPAPPKTLVRVCSIADLPDGSSIITQVGRRSIGVFNVKGNYYAFLNRCPHAGAPLCLGRITGMAVAHGPGFEVEWVRDREFLRCPWHAWEFELSTGRSASDPRIRAKKYEVTARDGSLWLEVPVSRDHQGRRGA